MEKAEKESVVVFKGNEIVDAEKLSYQQIAEDAKTSYRTVYAFLKRNDAEGSVETAAKIALAMGRSLNDLYVPKLGNWASAKSEKSSSSDSGSTDESDIMAIVDCLDYTTLSKVGVELAKKGFNDLAELCLNKAADMKPEARSDKNGD